MSQFKVPPYNKYISIQIFCLPQSLLNFYQVSAAYGLLKAQSWWW